jgi:glycosyltransferase involved in cell wall biosynthesis
LLDEAYKYYMNERFLSENDEVLRQARLVLWESTFPEFAYLPHLVKTRYGKSVIACPHNLEALIPNQRQRWYGNDKFDFLEQEIKSFRECDEIFTISEEDQWLLNLFGVNAHYLPYFPVGELYASLYEIRKYRSENDVDDYFLIVGSVENPPTRLGMTTLLENLKKMKCEIPIVVTGFGTEQLAGEFSTDSIKIIGSSHEKTLNECLKNCRGAIINQGFSTGALTKIPELMVAGVPIIVDEGGSRSFRRFDGVHVYKTVPDIIDIAMSDLKMPKLPEAPKKLTEYFQDCVSRELN